MDSTGVMDVIHQFETAIRAAGLTPPLTIEADGQLRRFASNGKPSDDSGWYVLHGDGIPAGAFGDWRTNLSQSWRVDIGRSLTPEEALAHRIRVDTMRAQQEEAVAQCSQSAAQKAAEIWHAAVPAVQHDYLTRKGIDACGARLHQGALVLPLRDSAGALLSLQFISTQGDKRFLPGGRVRGGHFTMGEPRNILHIVEGFATGASIHAATGEAVAVAFNAGNLMPVAQALREKFPELKLVLCSDDDHRTPGNPGLTKATEAAIAVNGWLAMPEFGENRASEATDFNDLHRTLGVAAVRQSLDHAQKMQPNSQSDATSWREPQPLTTKVETVPYPVDALPVALRAAVEEVTSFVKAPVALVAFSALAALSLAAQAHMDVKRADKLQGPTGLFLLTIADSGERKSTCDGFFTKAIRDFEEIQREQAKPALKDYRAAMEAWEAKYSGIKDKIRRLARDNKPTEPLEGILRDLEHSKPEPPKVPRLLYADVTPEALAYALAKNWPSGGVVSAEAGIVFGAHGMGKESVMRNLALLNVLWDGGTVSIDRRTVESFVVRTARLTMALQIQEATLRAFFDKTGTLARGTGFLPRFLISWPESTQGSRFFTEPPEHWPALAAFNQRLSAILNEPVPVDDHGELSPELSPLTPEAKAAWVAYHDAVEEELSCGGELYDVRDVASKSADNAARLAALFQVFEFGKAGAVREECFRSASRIAAWHLHEARRFFGELGLPTALVHATRLDRWIMEYCLRERINAISTREVQRLGPIREKETLVTALQELTEMDRVRVIQEGKRKMIQVNPALLEAT